MSAESIDMPGADCHHVLHELIFYLRKSERRSIRHSVETESVLKLVGDKDGVPLLKLTKIRALNFYRLTL